MDTITNRCAVCGTPDDDDDGREAPKVQDGSSSVVLLLIHFELGHVVGLELSRLPSASTSSPVPPSSAGGRPISELKLDFPIQNFPKHTQLHTMV